MLLDDWMTVNGFAFEVIIILVYTQIVFVSARLNRQVLLLFPLDKGKQKLHTHLHFLSHKDSRNLLTIETRPG